MTLFVIELRDVIGGVMIFAACVSFAIAAHFANKPRKPPPGGSRR